MAPVTIVDTTLRDGSHAKRHQFTTAHATAVAAGLDRAGVDVIEVAHGDGLGGSSFTYGLSLVDERELIAAAVQAAVRARIAVLALPGVAVLDDLRAAGDLGAHVARIATHCTEADIAIAHLGLARELGFEAVGFLMMAHRAEPTALAEQARVLADAGAQVVYVTDSAGALVPDGARARVAALRDTLPGDVAVGFHGHENLGLAVGNTLAAVEAGATWVDGCAAGTGAGAGNAATELLAAALERSGIAHGADVLALADVAQDVVRPILDRAPVADRDALLLGYAGVYSSFLLHAERAGERFGVPTSELLLEAGRRGAVGGQEDLLIDIAAELAHALSQGRGAVAG